MHLRRALIQIGLMGCLGAPSGDRAGAQNVIDMNKAEPVAPATHVTTEQVNAVLDRVVLSGPIASADAQRVAGKLDTQVRELLDGWPWKPFHHTLGISGYESYFGHPDELFYALALALPYLPPATAKRTKMFLGAQLDESAPYALEGWKSQAGRARESYDVPPNLRLNRSAKARSAFGVYAFWAWCHASRDTAAAKAHWAAIRERMEPLLDADYHFDVRKQDYSKDEAEKLNGDLAGLIGLVRLARLNNDPDTERRASHRVGQLLELRLNLERVNPRILEKTTASKSLHVSKLARYCALTPEIGEALRRWTDGCGAGRLKAFREMRNGWYLAFGDRLIGGENYTNPLHFPRSLLAGATLVEALPAEQLLTFIDVPWCKADFYFIEKCALVIWAASGRNWVCMTNSASRALP